MRHRRRQRKRRHRASFNVLCFGEFLQARERGVVSKVGCPNVSHCEDQSSKVPCRALETDSEISQRRQKENRSEKYDRDENISRGYRRADGARNHRGEDCDSSRNDPARQRAIAKTFALRVNPREQLWDQYNCAEREVDDENEIPCG